MSQQSDERTRSDVTRAPPLDVTIRDATRKDMPLIHKMIHELATYEGFPDGPELTVEDLIRDGFEQSPPWFFVLIAEVEGEAGGETGREVAGYALCNRAYSSWTRRAMYVEDLWVSERHRRRGVALAVLRALCERAVRGGVTRLDWHVLVDNTAALALYARLGARDLRRSERRLALRLDEHRIRAVAAGDLLSPRIDTL